MREGVQHESNGRHDDDPISSDVEGGGMTESGLTDACKFFVMVLTSTFVSACLRTLSFLKQNDSRTRMA